MQINSRIQQISVILCLINKNFLNAYSQGMKIQIFSLVKKIVTDFRLKFQKGQFCHRFFRREGVLPLTPSPSPPPPIARRISSQVTCIGIYRHRKLYILVYKFQNEILKLILNRKYSHVTVYQSSRQNHLLSSFLWTECN